MIELKDTKFFTFEEVCDLIPVSDRTLYYLIKDGKLKARKFGRQRYIAETELSRYLQGEEGE